MGHKRERNRKKKILFVGNPQKSANYLPQLMRAIQRERVVPGVVNHIAIEHDDWCDFLRNEGPCNCNPEVTVLGREQ